MYNLTAFQSLVKEEDVNKNDEKSRALNCAIEDSKLTEKALKDRELSSNKVNV